MSHTKVMVAEDYFYIHQLPGYRVAYSGALVENDEYGWSVYRSVRGGASERVASGQSKRTALRIALLLTSSGMLEDGLIEAVSPEDRVGVSSSRLGSWFAKP